VAGSEGTVLQPGEISIGQSRAGGHKKVSNFPAAPEAGDGAGSHL